ncbi:hypothetical protein C1H46_039212 [Malus baccata]|uniref:Uncharacterized protein n=1 Tax=Malus baccata TaxID=106549 RepID=A0A540KM55_MALBA|nr:hypothetical protein C1H46_039212 [Malus baccata]
MGRDGTGRNGEGAKMPSDGNKEHEEVIILCSMDVKRVVLRGKAERKFTQNSSRGTTYSTRFRRPKRGTERLVPLGRDGTGWNGEGAKMPLDGNKEKEGDEDVIILCSMDVERVVPRGEAERKFTQNSSRGTTCSTPFRRTKSGTERFIPLCFVPSHVPNGTYKEKKML